MLDLIEKALRKSSLGFARIDGTKSEAQRRGAIDSFRSNAKCEVLLASIGCAGCGYVLKCNRILLFDSRV